MELKFVFILLTGTLIGFLDVAQCDCNSTVIDQCTAPLSTSNTDLDFSGPNALGKPINASFLQTICSTLSDVNNCLKTKTTCDSADVGLLIKWTGINDSVSYLCNDGKAGLTQFQSCLSSSAAYTSFATCMGNITVIGMEDSPVNTVLNCKYMNFQFACYVNSAKVGCNSGDFVTTYFKKSQQPAMSVYGCTLDPKNQLPNNPCNYTKLNQCSFLLMEQPDSSESFYYNPMAALAAFNTSKVAGVCSQLAAANNCMKSVSGCDSSDPNGIINWNSANDSWSYICQGDQAGMIQYQKCYLNSTFVSSLSKCQALPGSQTPAAFCQFYNTQLSCLAQAAKVGCDSEQFVANVFMKAMNPIVKGYNCVLNYGAPGSTNPPGGTGTMSMVSSANGVILAAILLLVVLRHNEY